jgi:hypothetical protein
MMDRRNVPSFQPEYPDVRRQPRTFRIVLDSVHSLDGSTLTEAKFHVRLPDCEFNAKRLVLFVESIVHSKEPEDNEKVDKYPLYLELAEVKDPLSWSSQHNGPHGILAMTGSRTHVRTGNLDSIGATVVDRNLFERPITLRWVCHDEPVEDVVTNNWAVSLVLIDEGL